jgi:aspartyl-tRNA(Asn)/glutamyl-tRNA(Gln) amidotransferase subunit C
MGIDIKLVRHIARLSRLKPTEEELKLYQEQLSAILGYIDQLKELRIKEVDPFTHPGEFYNVFRDDEVSEEKLSKDEIFQSSPEKSGGFFVVPKIIE